MKILGISAHYHDSAAALVVDGVPVAAVQEERLSRRKNDAAFPIAAIEWCLDRAALDPADLAADGVGEWATLSAGHGARRRGGRGTSIRLLREIRFPHSLGMLYSTFTAYLGFAVNEDEYKVMALAAYGRPVLVDEVRKLIRRTPDGAFALDLEYFEYHSTARRSYSSRFVDLFGPPRNPYEPIDLSTPDGRRFADCAASVQRVLEDTLVDLARALHRETGLP